MAAYDAGLHEAPDPLQRKDEEKLKEMMHYIQICVQWIKTVDAVMNVTGSVRLL